MVFVGQTVYKASQSRRNFSSTLKFLQKYEMIVSILGQPRSKTFSRNGTVLLTGAFLASTSLVKNELCRMTGPMWNFCQSPSESSRPYKELNCFKAYCGFLSPCSKIFVRKFQNFYFYAERCGIVFHGMDFSILTYKRQRNWKKLKIIGFSKVTRTISHERESGKNICRFFKYDVPCI